MVIASLLGIPCKADNESKNDADALAELGYWLATQSSPNLQFFRLDGGVVIGGSSAIIGLLYCNVIEFVFKDRLS